MRVALNLACLSLPDEMYEPAGNHMRILLWFGGFPSRGAVVTYRIQKTENVLGTEQILLLAGAGMEGCGYVPCTMPLVTHSCEHGVPVSVTDTCPM